LETLPRLYLEGIRRLRLDYNIDTAETLESHINDVGWRMHAM